MRISLVFSPGARQTIEDSVDVPNGSTVAQALIASGWRERFALDSNPDMTYGVWNHPATLQTALQPDDRVEIYRALRVDPKVARRERFNKQGSKAAGLFAQRRPGAKPGY